MLRNGDEIGQLTEEMQMYLEVRKSAVHELALAKERASKCGAEQNETALKRTISGKATESVVRDHLVKSGLNISRRLVYIRGLDVEIDLLSLRAGVDPTKGCFDPEEVEAILEIKNTGVADQSTKIRSNFEDIRKIARHVRFAVIVLSERDDYMNTITEEKLGKDTGYKVFPLLARKQYINPYEWSESKILGEYGRVTREGVRRIRETGQWNKVKEYLRQRAG